MPVPNGTSWAHVPPVDQWPLRGGSPCLDFANTVAWRPGPQPFDALRGYDDLLAWGRHAGLLSIERFDGLRARAVHDEPAAIESLTAAVALREAIFRLFVALAHDRTWDDGDLATINAALVEGMARSAVVPDGDGFALRVPEAERSLALPLWLVAESAAWLLISGDWRRVRECPGHNCGWLFLDQTKNGNRRWCDSADCGNRARVRAHYQRRQSQGEHQPSG